MASVILLSGGNSFFTQLALKELIYARQHLRRQEGGFLCIYNDRTLGGAGSPEPARLHRIQIVWRLLPKLDDQIFPVTSDGTMLLSQLFQRLDLKNKCVEVLVVLFIVVFSETAPWITRCRRLRSRIKREL